MRPLLNVILGRSVDPDLALAGFGVEANLDVSIGVGGHELQGVVHQMRQRLLQVRPVCARLGQD